MNNKFTMKLQTLEEAQNTFFNPDIKQTDKIKNKKEIFLLKIPLLSLIYQKKGHSNFQIIVKNIRLVQTDFSEIIFDGPSNRTFNIILRGSVMLFIKAKEEDENKLPKLYKKIGIGEHFGEKTILGK